MLKKILTGALIGAGLLALTATAQADVELNIYGASAQYLFWNDAADDFLSARGCTSVSQANAGSSDGITQGTCGSYGTVTIRYSSKASYDGIYACKGQVPPGGQPNCSPNPRQRLMANTVAAPSPTVCKTITIGASDVAGSTFGQTTNGQLRGHRLGGYISRTIAAIDPAPATVLCRPVVVPFGFFKNTVALPSVDNLTYTQAGIIFSGVTTLWSDFDNSTADGGSADYPAKYVTACLRHAGSGTHATLVASVLKKVNGYTVATDEVETVLYFNDGSSDMMRCIKENGGQSTTEFGAIGYADADQCGDSGVCTALGPVTIGGVTFTDYGATLIAYQGALPTKSNIANGVYDFWSTQWLYLCAGSSSDQAAWAGNLCAFASDPENMPDSKAAWWPTASEMRVNKAGDFAPVLPGSNWGF
jgi:ABC-type phosphate transport system substrate-binding protein